ncbi:UNVERIFIED_CONTAM: hypothetical protein Sradi_4092600 [Sesamum radiatum]|uniref:MULE transposase domain-containing protein n=1 Tax=Sesamum radiatum TaxID=300843 RepID=A0AAW2PMX3_SESRA
MDMRRLMFLLKQRNYENTVLDDPAVGEWDTYMSMLTQDLPSLPIVTEAMGRFGLYENYSGSSSYASPSNYAGPSHDADPSLYTGPSNYAGPTSNASPSTYNEEDDDPESDSFLNNEPSDSEPDEVELEDQIDSNHENDDEVSIDVMMDVLGNNVDAHGNNADVPTTTVQDHFDLNMPTVSVPHSNLYPVLPLAFALVDEETLASWIWFLQILAKHFLHGEDDRVCLILDRQGGLINDINFVSAFRFPRGVYRFCLRHICSNFNNKYKNVQLKDLCWRAGAELSAHKFNRIMEEIKDLNEEAYDWLRKFNKTQWTLAHDGGWRTGILTTNISKACTTRANRMITAIQQWAGYAFRSFEARQAEAVQYIVQKFDYNQQSASVITTSTTG